MIEFENTSVWGFEGSIRGMRNPKKSWERSDSKFHIDGDGFYVGPNDMTLMRSLIKGGPEHRKFMRMIHVQVDITASHTWWAEFDTYKIGPTRNSCSKMHMIHVSPFGIDMFDHEAVDKIGGKTKEIFEEYIAELERLRCLFNKTKEKVYWRALIDMLPLGFRLRATIDMNYENIYNMRHQRAHHKLDEWSKGFFKWSDELPYAKELFEEEWE